MATIKTEQRELSILRTNNTFSHLERVNQQIENIDRNELTSVMKVKIERLQKLLTEALLTASQIDPD